MKRSILAAITLAVLGVSNAFGDNVQPVLNTPEPIAATSGSPGTATPTPYPQVAPPGVVHTSAQGNPATLTKIPQPGPPKDDEAVPGLIPKPATATP